MSYYINIGGVASTLDKDGNVWVSDIYHQGNDGLYRFNKEIGCFELVYLFPIENESHLVKHGFMRYYDKKLYLFPVYGEKIYVYDVDSNTHSYLDTKMTNSKAFSSTYMDGNVWLISNTGKDVYRYEFNKNKLIRLTEVESTLSKYQTDRITCIDSIEGEGKISFYLDYRIIILDIHTCKTKEVVIEKNLGKIHTVRAAAGKYWIFFQDSQDICSLNINTMEYIRYKCVGGEMEDSDSFPYEMVYEFNGRIIVPNSYSKHIMYIDDGSREVKRLLPDINVNFIQDMPVGGAFSSFLSYDKGCFFVPAMGDILIECDENMRVINKYESKARISERLSKLMLNNTIRVQQGIVYEGDDTRLNRFMEVL